MSKKTDHYQWITTVPVGDINFKSHLKDASLEELQKALAYCDEHSQHARGIPIQQELMRRRKAGGTALAVVGPDDKLMGKQLTDQFKIVKKAMDEVIKFGAMMMMLKENLSKRGEVSGGRGKKGGMSAWLKQFAPDVAESTAYRFMNVAIAVSKEFALPPKVSFAELATTPENKLPEKLRKKQTELFDFAGGRSNNSWLDRFKPPTPKGGKRAKSSKDDSDEEEDSEEQSAIDIYTPLIEQMRQLLLVDQAWAHLPKLLLTQLDDITITFRKLRSKGAI